MTTNKLEGLKMSMDTGGKLYHVDLDIIITRKDDKIEWDIEDILIVDSISDTDVTEELETELMPAIVDEVWDIIEDRDCA